MKYLYVSLTAIISLAILLSVFLTPSKAVYIQENYPVPGADYVQGELIVKYKDSYSPAAIAEIVDERTKEKESFFGALNIAREDAVAKINGELLPEEIENAYEAVAAEVGLEEEMNLLADENIILYSYDPQQPIEEVMNSFADFEVEYVHPNFILYPLSTPDDEYYDTQWALDVLQAESAWELTPGSSSVKVGVIDTGVDVDHPDLVGNVVTSKPFCNGCQLDKDLNGHGTHVAGIIGAVGNNGKGVTGINQRVSIYGYSIISEKGGSASDAARAIDQARADGMDVINMSIGSLTSKEANIPLMQEALKKAADAGIILVAAAGNFSADAGLYYPASDPNVITVAATTPSNRKASYSNFGTTIEIAAPGGAGSGTVSGDILSTVSQDISSACTNLHGRFNNPEYCPLAGTSMAAPYVSGLAALMLSVDNSLTSTQITQMMYDTATDLGSSGKDSTFGYGLINARKAVALANGTPVSDDPTPTPNPGDPTPTRTTSSPTPVVSQPNVSCDVKRQNGDYDCNDRVDIVDFEKWRYDFERDLASLTLFERFRNAYKN